MRRIRQSKMELYSIYAFLHYSVEALKNMGADYDTINDFAESIRMSLQIVNNYVEKHKEKIK